MNNPAVKAAGFVQPIWDTNNARHMTLFFTNLSIVPSLVASLAKSLGVKVTIQSWKYTMPQLKHAVARLTDRYNSLIPDGFKIVQTVIFDPNFEGIILRGHYLDGSVDLPKEDTLDTAATIAGVAVKFQYLGGENDFMSGRTYDNEPFYAGGLMRSHATGGVCSNGFAVQLNHRLYVTTARHCRNVPYYSFKDRTYNSQYSYGLSTGTQPSAGGARFLNAYGTITTFSSTAASLGSRTVSSYLSPSVGQRVYTGGGNSGTHPSSTIYQDYVQIEDDYGYFYAWWARNPAERTFIAAASGDSGGPDFAVHNDGTIAAEGMTQGGISGDDFSVPCHDLNNYVAGTTSCVNNVYISDMQEIVDSANGNWSLATSANT